MGQRCQELAAALGSFSLCHSALPARWELQSDNLQTVAWPSLPFLLPWVTQGSTWTQQLFPLPGSLWRLLLAVRALTPEPQPRKSSNPRPQQSPETLHGSRVSRRNFGAPNAEVSEGIVPLSL